VDRISPSDDVATDPGLDGYLIRERAGSSAELHTVIVRLAHLTRGNLDRARAAGRGHYTHLATHAVYDETGDLIGHRVHSVRRSLAEHDRKQAEFRLYERARSGDKDARRQIDAANRRAYRAFNREWEAGRMRGLRRDVGHGFETHDEWRARTTIRHRGRAPRPATNARTRGSRRGGSSSRSAGGGSSGGDSDGESDEPPGGRLKGPGAPCACGCGERVPPWRGPRARYVDDRHAARHRKRKERERKAEEDRARRERRRRCRSDDCYRCYLASDNEGNLCWPCWAKAAVEPEPGPDLDALRTSLAASVNGAGGHADRVARARAIVEACAGDSLDTEALMGMGD